MSSQPNTATLPASNPSGIFPATRQAGHPAARPAPIRTARPGRGTVGHLAAFDPRRQLPGDAAKRAALASDGPGRAVVVAPIRGTVHRAVKWGWPMVERGLRLRLVALVAGVAPGAEWGTPIGQLANSPNGHRTGCRLGHLVACGRLRSAPAASRRCGQADCTGRR